MGDKDQQLVPVRLLDLMYPYSSFGCIEKLSMTQNRGFMCLSILSLSSDIGSQSQLETAVYLAILKRWSVFPGFVRLPAPPLRGCWQPPASNFASSLQSCMTKLFLLLLLTTLPQIKLNTNLSRFPKAFSAHVPVSHRLSVSFLHAYCFFLLPIMPVP